LLVAAGSFGRMVGDRTGRRAEAEHRLVEAVAILEAGLQEGNPHAPDLVRAARQTEAQLDTNLVSDASLSKAAQLLLDLAMLEKLEQIRLDQTSVKEDRFDLATANAAYDGVFREYGIPVDALSNHDAAARIQERAIATHLAAALDNWALARKQSGAALQEWQRLLEVASAADPERDEWRTSLRERMALGVDKNELEKLAASAPLDKLQAPTISMLGSSLWHAGAFDAALSVLSAGQRRFPADFWLNNWLAHTLNRMSRWEEAIGFYRVALALRPRSPGAHLNVAEGLSDKGKLNEAIPYLRMALELKPDYAGAHYNLAIVLADKGRPDEAIAAYRETIRITNDHAGAHHNLGFELANKGQFDEAIAEYRESIRITKDQANAHLNLGNALKNKGRLDEAIAEYREAIRIKKDYADAHFNLGVALTDNSQREEAIPEYREAIRIKKDHADAHNNLGTALADKGLQDESIDEFREAIRIKKDHADAHYNLGVALGVKGRLDEAIAEYREAIRINKNHAHAHNNLGNALMDKGRPDEAIAEYREAIRVNPDDAKAHGNLGAAFYDTGDLACAIAAYQKAISLKPDNAIAHGNLGLAFLLQGRFAEAFAAQRRGHELGSKDPGWKFPSAKWVREAELLVPLEARLPKLLSGEVKPTNVDECVLLAGYCQEHKKLYRTAYRFYIEAFAQQSKLAEDLQQQHRYNAACAAALAGCGQGKDVKEANDQERARLRRQALDWLRADLAAYRQALDKEPEKARSGVVQRMQHWQQDKDFSGVRGTEALNKLPEDERQEWQKLWHGVETLKQAAKKEGATVEHR
jgi:tetratricopeptide (TPR) repeat protein